jgi:hypothetical protein
LYLTIPHHHFRDRRYGWAIEAMWSAPCKNDCGVAGHRESAWMGSSDRKRGLP